MISKETVERILDAARIEEVVGDFVQLKKRGVNLLGLCPFHNEKTPSFNVNPVRNIFKCFGCGKGGSPVNFVMEHEHYSYPEALRYLANKYAIEIVEDLPNPENEILRDEKESLYIINSYAAKIFAENLLDHEEGKSVGLTYFHERGFTDQTIEKFQLGYSLSGWTAFSDKAIKEGYQSEYLVKTGLSIQRKNEDGTDANLIDRFRGRIMFPVHNLTGKIIAFGGRILKKDDKAAKYVNSPESEIYFKSKSLYGIFHAKKAIVQRDNCYLVEGYTDVLSLHQSGLENVVASSGTSLTVEQIRLIARYTKNITVLYDGDAAGIKASLRGIDLILEEGLNVKVVLFPDGDDPDSYRRKHGGFALVDFIERNNKDFVVFKTGLLLDEVSNDPIRKAGLIHDVVETIGKIPDPITRSVYLKQCSAMLDIAENILVAELNKVRKKDLKKEFPARDIEELLPETILQHTQLIEIESVEHQEKDIIRLLLNYGSQTLTFHDEVDDEEHPGKKKHIEHVISVANFIVQEIAHDGIKFENNIYDRILHQHAEILASGNEVELHLFLNSADPDISKVSVEMLMNKYALSDNWTEMHQILVPKEEEFLKEAVETSVFHLKRKKVEMMLKQMQIEIDEAYKNGHDYNELLENLMHLQQLKVEICKVLGIDIIK